MVSVAGWSQALSKGLSHVQGVVYSAELRLVDGRE
jgi:hypothetical protein